tara:strand:- start:3065 stop:3166 length:102 start_codon:yes stop_codon:yes gene_type:complete
MSALEGWKLSKGKKTSQPTHRQELEELMRRFPD